MAVMKDGNGWRVIYRFTDWQGIRRQTQKRGFKTKKEAVAWEHEEILKSEAKLDMTFGSFVELYKEDRKSRIKETTYESKMHIVNTKILPYFKNRQITEIEPKDVIAWQNELMRMKAKNGKRYSDTYIRTVHSQLSAIFNHAVKYYHLKKNPAALAGTIGSKERSEMLFWTKEEYLKFAEVMMDKPMYYYAFEILYWGGLRLGEMLALTKNDFDFERKELTINKNFQKVKGKDVIQTPKTKKSIRTIKIPQFLCDEMKDYFEMLYDIKDDERIFLCSKSGLHHEMDRGSKEAGVKRIRIHDLRHSAVSLLIEMGFSALAIAERVGHESIDITFRYAHLFPTKQTDMADKLDEIRMSDIEEKEIKNVS